MENWVECLEIDNFKVNCILNDLCITNYMKFTGKLWEDSLEKYIKESYIENTNMIDIGSNIGTTSLAMSKYISNNSFIYAFEPVYDEILNMNVKENNLTNKIKVFPIGLSNKSTKLTGGFIDFEQKKNYGFTQIDKLKKADEKTKFVINVETLDSLKIENISFIKIDVEGCEREVLEGSINTIYKNTPTILIEIWCTSKNAIKKYSDNSDNSEIKKQFDIFAFLFNLGYICFPISPSSDDFLFIHYKRKNVINKILNIL
jgi:FkbM family methyltransferase